jgi:sulfide:quinone oxidoreductase
VTADPTRVLIAGGGVAGLEATLALAALAGDRVETEVLTPGDRFVYRPLLVTEPFGIAGATGLDLAGILDDVGAHHRRDALAGVDAGACVATTAAGEQLGYDALLIALGARPVDAVPGALAFGGAAERARFADVLTALGRRGTRRLAFVVPPEATWSIAAYELALLTAAERDVRNISGTEITLVTPESTPLALFGAAAAQLIAIRLAEAHIELRASAVAERFADRRLELAGGEGFDVDHVVALPALEVPRIGGLPQGPRGFVRTDPGMHVSGLEDVWAAGDVTSFPVKQGGLAAQQAEIAARSIAARAGAHVSIQPFQPLLRAALITGGAPEFLRGRLRDPSDAVAVEGAALWSPAVKLAARYLGPYLARASGNERPPAELVDLDPPEDVSAERESHERAVSLLLAAADADARSGHFEAALRWLSLVEELNLVIPTAYVGRREEWRERLDPRAEPDPAARRIDPRFATVEEGISDLRRRLGWLHELESRGEAEMSTDLAHLEAGIEELRKLAAKAGVPVKARGDHPRVESFDER